MRFIPNKWWINLHTPNQIMVILLDESGAPYNISGLTALTCKIKNADNTYTCLTQSQGLSFGTINPCWCYVFDLTADQTNAIGAGIHDVGIVVEIGAKKILLYYKQSLTVIAAQMDMA